ncbi:MAG: anti-sigma factor antagonist [Tildeniella torsiva UHER 1998/13D]|jgi:anti-sigma B factor antagonist|nr:anti-sigma factor antagonist [Tildeniella torsiva UHER 1998/13D]
MELKQQILTATDLDTQAPTPVTLITLAGDIDGSTAPSVQTDILAAAAPDIKMILEMTQVSYMSSAGLRVLLAVYRQATAQNGQVVLVGLVEEIKDTMSVTGFLDFFTTTDTLNEAFAVLKLQP